MKLSTVFGVSGGVLAAALAVLAGVALWPPRLAALSAHPQPAQDYEQAMRQFTEIEAAEAHGIADYGRSWLLTHGQRTERAIVFIHGITNSPKQYVQLAPLFFERGYNVYVPRVPHHGLINRSTDDLRHLTAEELCAFGDQISDLVCGLGQNVIVAGISAGGVLAAWLAQQRADVLAVQIASAFRTDRVPAAFNTVAMKLFTRLPNAQIAITDGLPHAYAAHSTRGFGEVMRLGEAVRRDALSKPPRASQAIVITNANDDVDNALTYELVERWQRNGMNTLVTYEFPKNLGLIHDVIDPAQKQQQINLVYPVLLDLIDQPL